MGKRTADPAGGGGEQGQGRVGEGTAPQPRAGAQPSDKTRSHPDTVGRSGPRVLTWPGLGHSSTVVRVGDLLPSHPPCEHADRTAEAPPGDTQGPSRLKKGAEFSRDEGRVPGM